MDFTDELNNILDEYIGIHLNEFDGYGATLKSKLDLMELKDINIELVEKIIDKRCKLEISNFKDFSHDVHNTIEEMIKNQVKSAVRLIQNSLINIDNNELYQETVYTKRYLIEMQRTDDLVSLKRVICKIAYKQLYVGLKKQAYELLKERYRFFNTQLTVKADRLNYEVEKIKLEKMNKDIVEQQKNMNIDKFRGEFVLELMNQNYKIDEFINKIDILLIEKEDHEKITETSSTIKDVKIEKRKIELDYDNSKSNDLKKLEETKLNDEQLNTDDLSDFFQDNKKNTKKKMKKDHGIFRKIIGTIFETAMIIILFYVTIYLLLQFSNLLNNR